MASKHRLGDLQLAIMRVLWNNRNATVAEVHRELLDERGLAPTTIATMLVKMEKKGVVAHDADGRRFVYRPTIDEADVRRTMVDDLTERLFAGDAAALVTHLLAEHDTSSDELAELKRRIAEAETEATGGADRGGPDR